MNILSYFKSVHAQRQINKLARKYKNKKLVIYGAGEYYQIQYNYIDRPSNLYFQVSYRKEDGSQLLYTNASEYPIDDLKRLGRYLYLSGDSIIIDTNLKYYIRTGKLQFL